MTLIDNTADIRKPGAMQPMLTQALYFRQNLLRVLKVLKKPQESLLIQLSVVYHLLELNELQALQIVALSYFVH